MKKIKGMDIHELLAATSINIRPPKKQTLGVPLY